MRIHSNKLSMMHIIHALNDEKMAGRIAHTVTFKKHETLGSRSHAHAFEIQLESSEHSTGRRRGNDGSYGANLDGWAAMYDEWGWLLAALYAKDPDMVVGTNKNPVYANSSDFHERTGMTYWAELADIVETTVGDPYPYTDGYTANRIGRRGVGRITRGDADRNTLRGWTRHQKFAPRTAEWARAWYAGEVR